MLELQQIKELEQLINQKQPQQQSKAQIIIEMIKLILEKNIINELKSVYVENEKLNYYFNKIGNKEGIKLLNQLASISIGWTIVKDNLQNTALLRQSKIPDQLILESIQFDKINLTAKLSKKLKKILKQQQVKMIHFSSHLEQSNEGIVRFLINNLSDSKFKKELVYEKPSNILCIIGKAHAQIQNSMKEKLKIIYLNEICQQMIVFPEILNELEINQGIAQVRNSYQSTIRNKALHLVFQCGTFISTMDKLQDYFHQKIHSESQSQIRQIYQLLIQMNEFINSNIQNDSKLIENSEFNQSFINYSANDKIFVNKLFKQSLNRNTRKMLQYMIKKQVVFPELINFLHIIDTSKTQRPQFKKKIEFVNFIENNREIQQFMNICVNGENGPHQKIKLTDFEILPQIKVIDTCMDEVEEQSSIINILQILFNQKEMHIDALKFVFQQSTVQSLIQDMKLIYAQRPHKRKQLLKAYKILYDLNYWIQNIQLEENRFKKKKPRNHNRNINYNKNNMN